MKTNDGTKSTLFNRTHKNVFLGSRRPKPRYCCDDRRRGLHVGRRTKGPAGPRSFRVACQAARSGGAQRQKHSQVSMDLKVQAYMA